MTKQLEKSIDQALLVRILQGDEMARVELLNRYSGLAIKAARDFCKEHVVPPQFTDDFISVYFEYVNTAIEKYDYLKGNFFAFWHKMATFAALNCLKDYHRLESSLEEREIEVTSYYFKQDEEEMKTIKLEQLESIIRKNKKEFKPDELLIIRLILRGYDVREIVRLTSINTSRYYRLRKSGFKKIRTIIIKNK